MNIQIQSDFNKANALIIGGFEDNENNLFPGNPRIKQIIERTLDWKCKFNKIKKFDVIDEAQKQTIILIGLGKKSEIDLEKIRKALATCFRHLESKENKTISLWIESLIYDNNENEIVQAAVESALLTAYEFSKYKSDWKSKKPAEFHIIFYKPENNFSPQIEAAKVIAEATNNARDLVNEPANYMTPLQLAEEAVKAGKKFGFETEIKNEKQIKELGMEAFLEVSKGSVIPPRLIVMRYLGNPESKEKLGLVGKGLAYDSGGYSLKTGMGMLTMKCDMGGSAAVIGALAAIAGNKLKVNVVGVVAACENMLSGSAYRPGDVIGSMGGKSIEVISTDAEGRLTLIDAVTYTQEKEGVDKIVDIATLTGGAMVALGTVRSAVLSNNDEFYAQLESASEQCGEKVWRLPTDDEYKELLESPIADMKNSGGRSASAITAGLFIQDFIKDIPWLHIDIAGKAFSDKIKFYSPKGGTGLGVRMLYNLAEELEG
jgi:leucyl aminopeptidase